MNTISNILGKTLIKLMRLRGGSGSALPGVVVEKLNKNYLRRAATDFDKGIIAITGTNGKTSTTKLIVDGLEATGLRVLTNKTGSNFTRGIISTFIDQANFTGALDFDIAVIEMDEAYSPLLCEQLEPDVLLALNVHRDQLDRYGEIAQTAAYIAQAATHCDNVVVNASDPSLISAMSAISVDKITTFGPSQEVKAALPSDDELHSDGVTNEFIGAEYTLESYDSGWSKSSFTMRFGNTSKDGSLKMIGAHNALNAVAAFAAIDASLALDDSKVDLVLDGFASALPAFGRGEILEMRDKGVLVGLVKNPVGFDHNLNTMLLPEVDTVLITMNDKYADGRDVSWYWDVHFERFADELRSKRILVSGVRGEDMALRLSLIEGLDAEVVGTIGGLIKRMKEDGDMKKIVLLASYTAMLESRRELAKYANIARMHE